MSEITPEAETSTAVAGQVERRVMPEFERENRYLVIKRSDLRMAEKLLKPEAFEALETLEKMANQVRANRGKHPLLCAVVEHDWPEYEPTWRAIEERVIREISEICPNCDSPMPEGCGGTFAKTDGASCLLNRREA